MKQPYINILAAKYLIARGADLTKDSVVVYENSLASFTKWCETNSIDIQSMSPGSIRKYLNFMINLKIEPSTRNRILSVVKNFLNWLMKNDLLHLSQIPKDRFWKFQTLIERRPETLAEKDMHNLIEVMLDQGRASDWLLKRWSLFCLFYCSGLKSRQVLDLKVGEMLISSEKMCIVRPESQAISIPLVFHDLLSRYLKSIKGRDPREFLFQNGGGAQLSRTHAYNIISKCFLVLDVKERGSRLLNRTYLGNLVNSNDYKVQDLANYYKTSTQSLGRLSKLTGLEFLKKSHSCLPKTAP